MRGLTTPLTNPVAPWHPGAAFAGPWLAPFLPPRLSPALCCWRNQSLEVLSKAWPSSSVA